MMRCLLLCMLLVGAAVNLSAGARRPIVERAILSHDHYAHADRAAEAVTRLVPPDKPLAIVVYDQDLVGELDAGVWFDYRAKWLLYPRELQVFRVDPGNPLLPRPAPGESARVGGAAGEYLQYPYLLFFRVTAAPSLPAAKLTVLAEGPMWVLARPGGGDRATAGQKR